jgi:hypothetical protein
VSDRHHDALYCVTNGQMLLLLLLLRDAPLTRVSSIDCPLNQIYDKPWQWRGDSVATNCFVGRKLDIVIRQQTIFAARFRAHAASVAKCAARLVNTVMNPRACVRACIAHCRNISKSTRVYVQNFCMTSRRLKCQQAVYCARAILSLETVSAI